MEYVPISFIAGVLTVLAPCTFTLLPIILGGSLGSRSWKKPVVIIASLSISIILFTLILRASTALIDIPQTVWSTISGVIIAVFGLLTLFPSIWDRLAMKLKLSSTSDKALQQAARKEGFLGHVLIGAALGPVFSSCSPTYAVILATILPQSFISGLVNLIFYALGLAFILLLVALLGQNLISRIKWAVDPKGWFKRALGALLLIIGVFIIFRIDKKIETWYLEQGPSNIITIEQDLLDKMD